MHLIFVHIQAYENILTPKISRFTVVAILQEAHQNVLDVLYPEAFTQWQLQQACNDDVGRDESNQSLLGLEFQGSVGESMLLLCQINGWTYYP